MSELVEIATYPAADAADTWLDRMALYDEVSPYTASAERDERDRGMGLREFLERDFAYNPAQPRAPRGTGIGGRWVKSPGGSFGPEGLIPPGGASGEEGDPIDVGSDVELAAKLISEGKFVTFQQPRQVSVLLDKLAAIVDDAKAKGETAPTYDLCKVTVRKTSLFCVKNKGIPRIQMPQLKGIPVPGSPADARPRDKRGEVDLLPEFLEHLQAKGATIRSDSEHASHMLATQNELEGNKVAGIAKYLEGGGTIEGSPLLVTEDNYIIDGHHRWAAVVGVNARDDDLENDPMMELTRVGGMDIIDVLREAVDFAVANGIPTAGIGPGKKSAEPDSGESRLKDWGLANEDRFRRGSPLPGEPQTGAQRRRFLRRGRVADLALGTLGYEDDEREFAYNPNQLRAPRGTLIGGRWIKGGDIGLSSPSGVPAHRRSRYEAERAVGPQKHYDSGREVAAKIALDKPGPHEVEVETRYGVKTMHGTTTTSYLVKIDGGISLDTGHREDAESYARGLREGFAESGQTRGAQAELPTATAPPGGEERRPIGVGLPIPKSVDTKGDVNYYGSYEHARLVRDQNPGSRIVQYERGYAVQLERSGAYVGPSLTGDSKPAKPVALSFGERGFFNQLYPDRPHEVVAAPGPLKAYQNLVKKGLVERLPGTPLTVRLTEKGVQARRPGGSKLNERDRKKYYGGGSSAGAGGPLGPAPTSGLAPGEGTRRHAIIRARQIGGGRVADAVKAALDRGMDPAVATERLKTYQKTRKPYLAEFIQEINNWGKAEPREGGAAPLSEVIADERGRPDPLKDLKLSYSTVGGSGGMPQKFKYLTVDTKSGERVGLVEYGVKPEGVFVHGIAVSPNHRHKGVARAMLAELHENTGGKPIVHGSFSTANGVKLGVFMATRYPEWNKLWVGYEGEGTRQHAFWEPGTPLPDDSPTFAPLLYEEVPQADDGSRPGLQQMIADTVAKARREQVEQPGQDASRRSETVSAALNFLRSEAELHDTAESFVDSLTGSNLMDLSNRERHRFGRAVASYPDERRVSLEEVAADPGLQSHVGAGDWIQRDSMYRSESRAIYGGGDTVTIYRGVPTGVGEISIGDWVAIDPEYARISGESNNLAGYQVVAMQVPKSDVVWGEADLREWVYSPRELREQVGNLTDFWKARKTLSGGRAFAYNPEQLRAPGGTRIGGRWISGGNVGLTQGPSRRPAVGEYVEVAASLDQFTREDVRAGRVPGVVEDETIRPGVAAHARDESGLIRLSPTSYLENGRLDTLLVSHEIGHHVANEIQREEGSMDALLAPFRRDPGYDVITDLGNGRLRVRDRSGAEKVIFSGAAAYENPFGVSNDPSEIMADAYSELLHQDLPEDPARRALLERVARTALKLGLPGRRIYRFTMQGSERV